MTVGSLGHLLSEPLKLIRRNTGRPQYDRLQYVVNASVPVVRVDASTYYSLQNGMWFVDTATTSPPR